MASVDKAANFTKRYLYYSVFRNIEDSMKCRVFLYNHFWVCLLLVEYVEFRDNVYSVWGSLPWSAKKI